MAGTNITLPFRKCVLLIIVHMKDSLTKAFIANDNK